MNKKFFFILVGAFLICFISFWIIVSGGYDRQNKIILFIKKIIPSHLARKVRDTVFIIPNLKERNKVLSLQVEKYEQGLQEGIYLHYKMLSEASPLPLVIYNVPGRTASNISAETTLQLANNLENICAIKEASGDISQIEHIINNKPDGFFVISGDDALTSRIIEMGGDGVISVIGQSHPGLFSKMVKTGLNGKYKEARLLHEQLSSIYQPLYSDGNPSGIKATLCILGICKNILRPPLVPVTSNTFNKLKKVLGQ